PPPPCTRRFPYTTLFRSYRDQRRLLLEQQRAGPQGQEGPVSRLGEAAGLLQRVAGERGAARAAQEGRRPRRPEPQDLERRVPPLDRKSTRLNSSHGSISY